MTLLPDSPYIVLSAGEDGQVLNLLKSIEQNPQNVNFRCCRLISGSPSLTRYYFWGMKKTKRFDFTHCHPRFFQKFPPGANLQYPLLSHKFPPLLHVGQVGFLSPFIPHNLKKTSTHRDQFIRVFDRRYLGLEARGGGQVFWHGSHNLWRISSSFWSCCKSSFFLSQVYRHCPTDLRDSDSFKAYITCAVFSGDGQEVKFYFFVCLALTIVYNV